MGRSVEQAATVRPRNHSRNRQREAGWMPEKSPPLADVQMTEMDQLQALQPGESAAGVFRVAQTFRAASDFFVEVNSKQSGFLSNQGEDSGNVRSRLARAVEEAVASPGRA